MYFGSFRGIDRFDGTKIINIPFPYNNDKEDNFVRTIVEEDAGHLLLGNNTGLWRLDKRKLSIKRIYEKEIDCQVFDIKHTKSSKDIIVKTQYGDWILKKGRRESLEPVKRTVIANKLQQFYSHQEPKVKRAMDNSWGRFNEANRSFTMPTTTSSKPSTLTP